MRGFLGRGVRGCGTWFFVGIGAVVVLSGTSILDAGGRSTTAIAVIGIGIVIAALAVVDYFRGAGR